MSSRISTIISETTAPSARALRPGVGMLKAESVVGNRVVEIMRKQQQGWAYLRP